VFGNDCVWGSMSIGKDAMACVCVERTHIYIYLKLADVVYDTYIPAAALLLQFL
jgi:hypothetical protein